MQALILYKQHQDRFLQKNPVPRQFTDTFIRRLTVRRREGHPVVPLLFAPASQPMPLRIPEPAVSFTAVDASVHPCPSAAVSDILRCNRRSCRGLSRTAVSAQPAGTDLSQSARHTCAAIRPPQVHPRHSEAIFHGASPVSSHHTKDLSERLSSMYSLLLRV